MKRLYYRITARLPRSVAVYLDRTLANKYWWKIKMWSLRGRVNRLKRRITRSVAVCLDHPLANKHWWKIKMWSLRGRVNRLKRRITKGGKS